MSDPLALLGGSPVLSSPLKPYNSIGEEEVEAVNEVVRSGQLSGFYGSAGEHFDGGTKVREFEDLWSEAFRVKYTVSVNSATSGLYAAIGAIGICPGDEVIVPPLTMSATVMAPLLYGGIPIFADVDPDTFCLDPISVKERITSKTKAIIAVNLFGHPAQLRILRDIADAEGIWLIEDNAQAPLAMEGDAYSGTVGDIGIFSLNYHKHIHTGEGGMCVTNNSELALRLRLIRNHGENVVEDYELDDITNLVCFNYRMTEIAAAIGIQQLNKVNLHVDTRERASLRLSSGIEGLEGLNPPLVRDNCRHVYYIWALKYDEEAVGINRELFSEALSAEGFPHFLGYVRPLYMLPVFQRRIAIGTDGFPFNLGKPKYHEGICPISERMFRKELILFEPCAYQLNDDVIDQLIQAIQKVYNSKQQLLNLA